MPIYVGGHSADVWSNQKLFELGPTGAPANVSGVPPDFFSETGEGAGDLYLLICNLDPVISIQGFGCLEIKKHWGKVGLYTFSSLLSQ